MGNTLWTIKEVHAQLVLLGFVNSEALSANTFAVYIHKKYECTVVEGERSWYFKYPGKFSDRCNLQSVIPNIMDVIENVNS